MAHSAPAHQTETLPGGTRVWVNHTHKIGTDALLLAEFCTFLPSFSLCDLGSGCGIVLLALLDKGLAGPATGVELSADGAALLQGAAKENNMPQVQSLGQDLRSYRPKVLFDMVVANPPYFSQGQPAQNPQRAVARHQLSASLNDFCACARRILKDGGRFCLCYPASRLASLYGALAANGFAPKRMQLVRKRENVSPWLVLLDARKAGGEGLTILPDRILAAPVHY